MKNLLIIITAAALFLSACQMADRKTTGNELSDKERKDALTDSSKYTSIQWLDSTYRDLGKVKEGTKVEVSYHFKNTGKYPLVLANVSAQCGCTTPDWPKTPIMPGEENVVKAVFNSDGRKGENHKEVYVNANTTPQSAMTLSFRVEITE